MRTLISALFATGLTFSAAQADIPGDLGGISERICATESVNLKSIAPEFWASLSGVSITRDDRISEEQQFAFEKFSAFSIASAYHTGIFLEYITRLKDGRWPNDAEQKQAVAALNLTECLYLTEDDMALMDDMLSVYHSLGLISADVAAQNPASPMMASLECNRFLDASHRALAISKDSADLNQDTQDLLQDTFGRCDQESLS